MPRYGGYGQYGADPGDLMQGAGNNPFYNPYSKYPNWGGGISSIIQQFMQMKMLKDKQKQEKLGQERDWANQQTDQYYKEQDYQRQLRAEAKPPEWKQKVDALVQSGVPQVEAYKAVFGIKTEEDLKTKINRLYEESKARTKGVKEAGGGGGKPTGGLTEYQKGQPEREYKKGKKDINSKYTSGLVNIEKDFLTKKQKLIGIDDKIAQPAYTQLVQDKKLAINLLNKQKQSDLDDLEQTYHGAKKPTAVTPLVPTTKNAKSAFPSIKKATLPLGTEIKKMPDGRLAAKINNQIYIIEQ